MFESAYHMTRAQRAKERALIEMPTRWPGTRLCLKRRATGGPPTEFGMLYFACAPWAVMSRDRPGDPAAAFVYADLDALLDDGWVVD